MLLQDGGLSFELKIIGMSKAPGVKLGHDDLETITGRHGVTLRVWHKNLESHAIPKKLVRVTRGKTCLAHAHGLDNTTATQLFKHLEKIA